MHFDSTIVGRDIGHVDLFSLTIGRQHSAFGWFSLIPALRMKIEPYILARIQFHRFITAHHGERIVNPALIARLGAFLITV